CGSVVNTRGTSGSSSVPTNTRSPALSTLQEGTDMPHRPRAGYHQWRWAWSEEPIGDGQSPKRWAAGAYQVERCAKCGAETDRTERPSQVFYRPRGEPRICVGLPGRMKMPRCMETEKSR